MIRGIYNSSAAMQYLMERTDTVANNLANANTVGFKRSDIAFNMYMTAEHATRRNQINDPLPRGELKTFVDHTQGALKQTANPLNIAIEGQGYFTIQTPEGTAWTRDGGFTMNEHGYLTTMDGYFVMGEWGPILLQGNNFSVSYEGDIVYDNQVVNRFLLQNFDKSDVLQKGSNLYFPRDEFIELSEANPLLKQGFIEASNVSVIKEMIAMITIQRQYQANEKAIRTNDEALQRTVRDIAR